MIQAAAAYGTSIYSAISTQNSGSVSAASTDQDSSTQPFLSQSPEDTVTLSRQGIRQAGTADQNEQQTSEDSNQNPTEPKGQDGEYLSQQEQEKLRQLKIRDTEVKAHEQAHLSVAGQYAAGGASFSYENGPDGVKYAVGGEVPIDIGKESSPEATLLKMQTVKRAALAPANPSSADRMIAAQADQKAARARQELMREQNSDAQELLATDSESSSTSQPGTTDENEIGPEAVEGSTRKTLAINTYQQIASMVQ